MKNQKIENVIKKKPEYELVGKDPKRRKNIIVRHESCNKIFSIPIREFKNGKGCKECNYLNNYKKRFYDFIKDEYTLLEYNGSKREALYLHNDINCMGKFKCGSNYFFRLKRCPECLKSKIHYRT